MSGTPGGEGGEGGGPLMDIPIVTTEGGPSPAAVARAARDQARLKGPLLPPRPPAPELPPGPTDHTDHPGHTGEQGPAPQRIVHDQQSRPVGQMVVPLVVFLLVALVGWGIVAGTGGDEGAADDGEQESPDGGGPRPDAAPVGVDDGSGVIDAADITPEDAFVNAAAALETGGSFTYAGSVAAEGASPLHPTHPLAPEFGVVGNVELPGRVREVAIDESGDNGVADMILIADEIWQRSALSVDELDDLDYVPRSNDDLWLGAALLPQWLARVTDARDIGTAPDGAHSFSGDLVTRDDRGLTGERTYEVTVTYSTNAQLREVRIELVGEGNFVSIAWVIDDIGSAPPVLGPGELPRLPDDADNLPSVEVPDEG